MDPWEQRVLNCHGVPLAQALPLSPVKMTKAAGRNTACINGVVRNGIYPNTCVKQSRLQAGRARTGGGYKVIQVLLHGQGE